MATSRKKSPQSKPKARKTGRGRTSPEPQADRPLPPPPRSVLAELGIIGYFPIESVILAALASETPLLLIGPHGTAKSLLLERLCQALDLNWRHYNASLLNYDDLVGYPLPDSEGRLQFVKTPASIWDAEAVFLDEISRCRPDLQNRLFPIIHEKRVQGMPLERLVYRWSAMNPPANPEHGGIQETYIGSEPLDAALADRFGFILNTPEWWYLSTEEQLAIIRSGATEPSAAVNMEFQTLVKRIRAIMPHVEETLGQAFANFIQIVAGLLLQAGLVLSGRRANQLYRNLIAVHAAELAESPQAHPSNSAYMALRHSLPQRALGIDVQDAKLLIACNSAWVHVRLAPSDPVRLLVSDPDPLHRTLLALDIVTLPDNEFSAYVADGLAHTPLGGRHALACYLMEHPAAGRLNAAVAEQVCQLAQAELTGEEITEQTNARYVRHQLWQAILQEVSQHPEGEETDQLSNLLASLFAQGAITRPEELRPIVDAWHRVKQVCKQNRAQQLEQAA